MKFELFKEVAIAADIPEHHLNEGDIATVVDYLTSETTEEQGTPWRYSIHKAKPWTCYLFLRPLLNRSPAMRYGMSVISRKSPSRLMGCDA